MNSVDGFFNFGNWLTIYDHYSIERVIELNQIVIELNQIRKLIKHVLSEREFVSHKGCLRLLYVIDDFSLRIINKDVDNIVQKIDKIDLLRVVISQVLSIKNFKKTRMEKKQI